MMSSTNRQLRPNGNAVQSADNCATTSPAELVSSASALIVVNATPGIWHHCMEALAICSQSHGVHMVEVFRLSALDFIDSTDPLPPGLVLLHLEATHAPIRPHELGVALTRLQNPRQHKWVPIFSAHGSTDILPPALMQQAPVRLDHTADLTDYINLLSVYLFLRPHAQSPPKPLAGSAALVRRAASKTRAAACANTAVLKSASVVPQGAARQIKRPESRHSSIPLNARLIQSFSAVFQT